MNSTSAFFKMFKCNMRAAMRSPTKSRGQLHSTQLTQPEGTLPSNHLGRAFANSEHLKRSLPLVL